MNYLVFDKNLVLIDQKSGYKALTTAAKEDGTDTQHEELATEIIVTEPGYVYIYLSNDSPVPKEVYFDGFTVMHAHSPIVQSDDYYPFGLSFNSYKRENSVANKHLYQGKEIQDALGLKAFDFEARMYDPAIGRTFQLDPHSDSYYDLSGYSWVANNPLANTDPTGMDIDYGGGLFGGDLYTGEDIAPEFNRLRSLPTEPKNKEKKQEEEKSKPDADLIVGVGEGSSFQDQSGGLGEFATGVSKTLSSLARYDAFVQWIKEDKPHFIDPATGLPRKDLVPSTYDLGQHIESGTDRISGKLNAKGVIAHYLYTTKNGHLVDGMKLYNNLNTYGTGPSGPAIALTGGSSEIAHIFFGSVDSRNTFLDNYYYARKAVHLEHFRNRGK